MKSAVQNSEKILEHLSISLKKNTQTELKVGELLQKMCGHTWVIANLTQSWKLKNFCFEWRGTLIVSADLSITGSQSI